MAYCPLNLVWGGGEASAAGTAPQAHLSVDRPDNSSLMCFYDRDLQFRRSGLVGDCCSTGSRISQSDDATASMADKNAQADEPRERDGTSERLVVDQPLPQRSSATNYYT